MNKTIEAKYKGKTIYIAGICATEGDIAITYSENKEAAERALIDIECGDNTEMNYLPEGCDDALISDLEDFRQFIFN